MKRLLHVLTTIPICAGLMFAQQSTPSSTETASQSQTANQPGGQTWSGILVDARCSSTGMGTQSANRMDSSLSRSTATEQSMLNRTTPAGNSERTYNSTDANTSGTAGRGPGAASAQSSSANQPDMERRTPDATTGMDRRKDINAPRTGSMDRTDNAAASQGSGKGADTQAGNNTFTGSADRMAAQNHAGSASQSGLSNSGDQTGDVATANNMGKWDRSCFIGPSSTEFVLHTSDGRMIHLDSASNSRIVTELKNTQRVQNMNKIFRVRIDGNLGGDHLSVTNIQM